MEADDPREGIEKEIPGVQEPVKDADADEGHEEAGDDAGEEGLETVAEEGDDEEGLLEEEPRRNKATSDFRRVKNEAKAAKEEAARLRQEMDELQRSLRAPPPEDPRIEAERVALMTDREFMAYQLEKRDRAHEARMQQLQWQLAEQNDRAQMSSRIAANPELKKYTPQVEELRQREFISKGLTPPSREVLLKLVLGEERLSASEKALVKGRAKGQENIRRQTVSAGSPKGNVSASGGRLTEQERIREKIRNGEITF
jgi:predicted transcriptional regulator